MTLPFTITRTLAPGDWQKLRVALARNGVEVADEPHGTIMTHGVVAAFAQTGSSLTITVTSKPFYASCDKVAEILTSQINSALE